VTLLRIGLNAYLLSAPSLRGWTRYTVNLLAATNWGPEARPTDAEDARFAFWLDTWKVIAGDPETAVASYEVLVLACPSEDSAPPPALFTLYRRGPRWTIWIRP